MFQFYGGVIKAEVLHSNYYMFQFYGGVIKAEVLHSILQQKPLALILCLQLKNAGNIKVLGIR